MIKLASFALTATLGAAALVQSLPAAACPTVGFASPPAYRLHPLGYVHGAYWHHRHDWRDRDRHACY